MDLAGALDRGDLDELGRLVDACCDARDWGALAELRRRAASAYERGRQLWPIAARAEYRLALDAPAAHAAAVLVEGAGRFTLGPLPEVAAAGHTWDELAPHVAAGPPAVLALHERVVRGEECSTGPLPGPPVLELPRRLQTWEPAYPLAEYGPDRAAFPAPELPSRSPVSLPAGRAGERDAVTAALLDLVAVWTEDSDGRAEAVAVSGDALDAIAALGPPTARVAPLERPAALALLGWAGATGGAHGRRRGAAAGRFGAWWVLAALAGRQDDWPVDAERPGPGEVHADELDEATAALEWLAWDAREPASGWELRIAIADPQRRRAWAVAASDAAAPGSAGAAT